ncbi:signal transducer and activator of transcription 5B-like isoform X2 [Littorina saxatilis]|uniref:Signal transducer and activator of transcription n=1 Tax=Littorina saxatilis TaxID=31220 RepID=A0AAN9ATH1_9CAEN
MSRWATLSGNTAVYAKLQEFYSHRSFPIEVRYFLCTWFEDKQWNLFDPDNPEHEPHAIQLFSNLLALMRTKIQELSVIPDFQAIKMCLEQTLVDFKNQYENDQCGFLRVIQQCMDKEEELVKICQEEILAGFMDQSSQSGAEHRERVNAHIVQQLQQFHSDKSDLDDRVRKMLNLQESFIIQYTENMKINSQISNLHGQMQPVQHQLLSPHLANKEKLHQTLKELQARQKNLEEDKKKLESNLSELGKEILQSRLELADSYNKLIDEVQGMQKRVLDDELISWKRRQQLGGNGNLPKSEELDSLQRWCESLAEIIWCIRQQIKRMGILRAQLPIDLPIGRPDLLPELNDTITGMLSSLVTSTFIVEQQPPQVLKKESRFSAKVRLLVGGKLNIQMCPPQVKATIISESQAKNMLRSDMLAKETTSGTILNNVGTMDWQDDRNPLLPSGCLSIHFRNMQLKAIKRSDKKGTEAVTEEKFCILFQSDFNVGGNDLVFQVWTLSLPVVVTVHGNQECNAMATVLWDNAFADPGRTPFVVPESVPWPKLGEQLHGKFQQMTGKGLSPDSLDYLASKVFNAPCGLDFSQYTVSWTQFNKETLQGRTFTFWEWFYAVLKLTKEHLKGPWNDGSIIGFISKTKAQECLNRVENGTFLLRFSDSECGGITIAWIAESLTKPGEREVWNLAPYIAKDFSVRGLADRIHDLKNLTFLYPEIIKDDAFQKYYTAQPESDTSSKNGYIATHLVQVIGAGQLMCPDNMSNPPRSPQIIPPSPAYGPDSNQTTLTENMEDMNMDLTEYLVTDYTAGDYDIIDANQFVTGPYVLPPYQTN